MLWGSRMGRVLGRAVGARGRRTPPAHMTSTSSTDSRCRRTTCRSPSSPSIAVSSSSPASTRSEPSSSQRSSSGSIRPVHLAILGLVAFWSGDVADGRRVARQGRRQAAALGWGEPSQPLVERRLRRGAARARPDRRRGEGRGRLGGGRGAARPRVGACARDAVPRARRRGPGGHRSRRVAPRSRRSPARGGRRSVRPGSRAARARHRPPARAAEARAPATRSAPRSPASSSSARRPGSRRRAASSDGSAGARARKG